MSAILGQGLRLMQNDVVMERAEKGAAIHRTNRGLITRLRLVEAHERLQSRVLERCLGSSVATVIVHFFLLEWMGLDGSCGSPHVRHPYLAVESADIHSSLREPPKEPSNGRPHRDPAIPMLVRVR